MHQTRLNPVAYFSMEVGLNPAMPTYSGGLGILAGDCLRAAADLGINMVAISLVHRKGYFNQHLDREGNQTETPEEWEPSKYMQLADARASVNIEGRKVLIQAWRYTITGYTGHRVPVYLLDTQVPENSPQDQALTDYLYGGDERYRLKQEVVLGIGGVAMLRALGCGEIEAYHMNEGHSSLLALALLHEEIKKSHLSPGDRNNIEKVRERCVFTTHTPVPAGIDRFPRALVLDVMGEELTDFLVQCDCMHFDNLDMIFLALYFSRYINGVSLRHEEVSHTMFPNYPINSITNGVHAATWTSAPFARLFDQHVPQWRNDNFYLRYMISASPDRVREAHLEAKTDLLKEVEKRSGVRLNPSVLTIGFARRMTAYKRADLLFTDLERLKKIAHEVGPLQVIYSGKAHPKDWSGKDLIRNVYAAAEHLKGSIDLVYLEDYDMALGKLMCSGVDLWLNTPQRPYEASGTSGMKAALNGVPSLSVLDGWWIEGHVEGVTGWSIGDSWTEINPARDAVSMYDKLENQIVPMFYRRPAEYDSIMLRAIALNGGFYTAQRMMYQYYEHAYTTPPTVRAAAAAVRPGG